MLKYAEKLNDILKKHKIDSKEFEKELLHMTQEHFYDDETEIGIVWGIDDIRWCDNNLTDEQCLDVLHRLKHKHDAAYGVSWDTIKETITLLK